MSACEVGFGLAWVSDLHLPALPPTHPPHAGAQCATAAHRIEIQAPAPCKPARPVWTKKFQKSTSTISHLPNNGLGEKNLRTMCTVQFLPPAFSNADWPSWNQPIIVGDTGLPRPAFCVTRTKKQLSRTKQLKMPRCPYRAAAPQSVSNNWFEIVQKKSAVKICPLGEATTISDVIERTICVLATMCWPPFLLATLAIEN